MSRFNTGNPINSLSEEDFYDNCLSLDQAMNSTDPTWRDRFNVEKPTIDAALKSTGFMPAGFDFISGGVLHPGDRNKCIYNPAPNGDNNWYRWNGAFPKEIAPNSQPNPKDENNWVPVIIKTGVVEREALRRTYQEVGLNLVEGSFEDGGVLNNVADLLLEEKTGKVYSWSGSFPKVVNKGTLPADVYWNVATGISNNILISCKRFGIVGDGIVDETEKLQLAFDYIHQNGPGTLYIPPNMRIKASGLLYGRNHVSIKCDPTSYIDFTGSEWLTPTNDKALLGYYGEIKETIIPIKDMLEGSNKINVPNASIFKVGDLVELSMDSNGKWDDTSVQVTAGQLGVITAVYTTTNNIVISEPLYETLLLSNGAKIRIIAPVENIVIDGLGIIGNGRNPNGNAEQGLKIFFGRNVEIKNCRIKDADTQSIGVISCYGAQIHNNEIIHPALGDIDVISYSIAYSSSMHVKIYNNKSINSRHGIISSHLARSYGYYGVSRFIDIFNNTHTSNYGDLSSSGFIRAHGGIASHTDAEFVNVYDNTIIGCRYGINIRTPNNTIKNNKIYDCPVGIYLSEYWGSLEIIGNYMNNCPAGILTNKIPYETPRGFINVRENTFVKCGGSGFTFPFIAGSNLLFSGNKFFDTTIETTTANISVYNTADVVIDDNRFDVKDTLGVRLENTGSQVVINNNIFSKIAFSKSASIFIVTGVDFIVTGNNIFAPNGGENGGVVCPKKSVAPLSVVSSNNLFGR